MTRGPFELPIARAVDDVAAELEASHVDAVVAFAERELGQELLPWQREVVEHVLAGRRPVVLGLRHGRRARLLELLEVLEERPGS